MAVGEAVVEVEVAEAKDRLATTIGGTDRAAGSRARMGEAGLQARLAVGEAATSSPPEINGAGQRPSRRMAGGPPSVAEAIPREG
jgi:hypothetical protein